MIMAEEWRRIVAVLANRDLRVAFARIVLETEGGRSGTSGASAVRPRDISALEASGLVLRDEGGRARVDEPALRALLTRASREPRPRGPERFLDETGRIASYPSRLRDELALLRLIAGRVLADDEVVDEAELNARLAPFDPDTARLRRALVDRGFLTRTPSGSRYRRECRG
jgi:hypothetical protein